MAGSDAPLSKEQASAPASVPVIQRVNPAPGTGALSATFLVQPGFRAQGSDGASGAPALNSAEGVFQPPFAADVPVGLMPTSTAPPPASTATPAEESGQTGGEGGNPAAPVREVPQPLPMSAAARESEWRMQFMKKDPKYKTVTEPASGEKDIRSRRNVTQDVVWGGWHAVRLLHVPSGKVHPFKAGETLRFRVWQLASTAQEAQAGQGSALEDELLVQDRSHFFRRTGSIYFGAPVFVKPGRYRIELEYSSSGKHRRDVPPAIINYRARDRKYEADIAALMRKLQEQEEAVAAGTAPVQAKESLAHQQEVLDRLRSSQCLKPALRAQLEKEAAAAQGAGMEHASPSLTKTQRQALKAMHLPQDPPMEVARAAAERLGTTAQAVLLALESEEARDQRLAEERARAMLRKLALQRSQREASMTAARRRKRFTPWHLAPREGLKAAARSWEARRAKLAAYEKQQDALEDGQMKIVRPAGDGEAFGLEVATRRRVALLRKPGAPSRRRLRRYRYDPIAAGETVVLWCQAVAPAALHNHLIASRSFAAALQRQVQAEEDEGGDTAERGGGGDSPATSATPTPTPGSGGDPIRRSKRSRARHSTSSRQQQPDTAADVLARNPYRVGPGGQPLWSTFGCEPLPPVPPAAASVQEQGGEEGASVPLDTPQRRRARHQASQRARGVVAAHPLPTAWDGRAVLAPPPPKVPRTDEGVSSFTSAWAAMPPEAAASAAAAALASAQQSGQAAMEGVAQTQAAGLAVQA